jgi:hypothetical protein
MQDPTTTNPLRRAWFSGYRPADVDGLLTTFGSRVSELWSEVPQLRSTLDELDTDRAQLRERLSEANRRELELRNEQRGGNELGAARAEAQALVDAAHLDATRIRGEASLEADTARAQVDELLRMRDTLAGTVRAVVREFESLVGRIDRGEHTAPGPVPAKTPVAPASAPVPALAVERTHANGSAVFDGRVELQVGPFDDFAALSAFERALGSLPKIEDIYIRRFEDDRATIDVTLQEPASLIDEMKNRLPYRLDIEHADLDRIAVTVSSPE